MNLKISVFDRCLKKKRWLRFHRDIKGQGMTEYILIVVLIAIGTIAAVTAFGRNIQGLFTMSTNALEGSEKNLKTETFTKKYGENELKRDLQTAGNTQAAP